MHRKATVTLAVAAAFGLPHAATAQTQDELRTLREQVRQLDRRVTDAEQAAIQASSRPTGENAMNPAVSVILNGIYSNLSQDPNAFRINGFVPTLGEVGPGVRGLSLGESELALAANIDHNFRGTLIASISPEDSIGVEEGYIQTLSLSYGFTIKAGRFFSAVGYQNQIHAHAWDFTDTPLANKVFLGNQLNEDGIQLKWVAPTAFYWDVGVEAGRGRQFPAGPAGGRNKNGVGSGNVFTHVGGDFETGTTRFSAPLNPADFPILARYNPTKHTLMADWSPSEFSRVRLQFASDKSRSDVTDNQVFLQYIVSLGAHGAHKF